MRKISKKYIEKLTLQEIQAFRDNRGEQVASDYWLCNQIGYINALLFLLNRHQLISLFDEVHNKIRNK
jgi:hypothetical protein